MMPPAARPHRTLCRVLLTAALASSFSAAFGASFGEWRYWQAQHGLADSFIQAISRDPSGAIWAVHGDIPAITRFDGRSFTLVKSPARFNPFHSAGDPSEDVLSA